jgi:hypothetical protein
VKEEPIPCEIKPEIKLETVLKRFRALSASFA